MTNFDLMRRRLVQATIAAGATGSFAATQQAHAATGENDTFKYEVEFRDEQWKSMFDAETYKILRHGDTEWPKSSKLWDDYREGNFNCIGCGLPNYTSTWRVELDKGWVFFSQSVPNSILMGIDGEPPSGMADKSLPATIEAHCRRCGSHMGHILRVDGKVVHCINGRSLAFTPA